MARSSLVPRLLHRLSPITHQRAGVLKRFYKSLGLVYFGTINQHDDDLDVIRGFSASLTHRDLHYAVGDYMGYSIRMVDRFDVVSLPGIRQHQQFWGIIEIKLHRDGLSHVLFIPTGLTAHEYGKVFLTLPYLQPLNSMLTDQHSREFHGRFQILARATHLNKIEEVFTSPIIASMATRFWPHGIEVEHGRLLVYITEKKLDKITLEALTSSAIWLAQAIDDSSD